MTTVRRTDSGKDARSDTIERTNPHAQTTRNIRKTISATAVTRVGNTRAMACEIMTMRLQHTRNKATSILGLVATVKSRPRPPLPLLPTPPAPVAVPLITRPKPRARASEAPSALRHSHTSFYVEPTGSSAACFKVSRRYAGDGSLRLERRSPPSGHGTL